MKKAVFAMALAALFAGPATFAGEEGTHIAKLKIEGMTCGMCAAKIKKNLAPLCKEVTIDWKKGKGSCAYEHGKATPEQIVKAVNNTGFKGTLVK